MLEMEADSVVKKAGEYFPKATAVELKLLRKLIKSLEQQQADDILDDVRTITKYQTLPLPEIASRIKAVKKVVQGDWTPCYALAREGNKTVECMVLCQSEEGAKSEFAKYMAKHGFNAVDFTLYIGHDSFNQFFDDRHERECELNPRIREHVKMLQENNFAGLRGLVTMPAVAETPVRASSSPQELTKSELGSTGTPTTFESLNRLKDDDIPF
ncbi:MAG: hypothetical protein ACYSWO_23325 [Planctomycetota bacterium]|jgi:hypothetical protein